MPEKLALSDQLFILEHESSAFIDLPASLTNTAEIPNLLIADEAEAGLL